MALTIAKLTNDPSHVSGNVKVRYRLITFDDSYPAAGEPIAASDFGLTHLYLVEVLGPAQAADESLAYVIGFDPTGSTLVAYEGDNDNAGDAPLIQADDTDDLDGYYVIVKAVGI